MLPQKMKALSEVTLQVSELSFKAVPAQACSWLCVDSAGPRWGEESREAAVLPLPFLCLPQPLPCIPPALLSQLPDFIAGDLFWAFTIGPSEGLLTSSETLREAHASFATPTRNAASPELWSPGLGAWE